MRCAMAEPRWDVRCLDPFGRARALTVLVDRGRVVLVPPPGASAVLSTAQAQHLRQALDQAEDRASER
jgi:hypothetical protein